MLRSDGFRFALPILPRYTYLASLGLDLTPEDSSNAGRLDLLVRHAGQLYLLEFKLVFMTGVTKFSKVSLFSGLNQLNDLTLDARFATVCGYTQQDLGSRTISPSVGRGLGGRAWSARRRWTRGCGGRGR